MAALRPAVIASRSLRRFSSSWPRSQARRRLGEIRSREWVMFFIMARPPDRGAHRELIRAPKDRNRGNLLYNITIFVKYARAHVNQRRSNPYAVRRCLLTLVLRILVSFASGCNHQQTHEICPQAHWLQEYLERPKERSLTGSCGSHGQACQNGRRRGCGCRDQRTVRNWSRGHQTTTASPTKFRTGSGPHMRLSELFRVLSPMAK